MGCSVFAGADRAAKARAFGNEVGRGPGAGPCKALVVGNSDLIPSGLGSLAEQGQMC